MRFELANVAGSAGLMPTPNKHEHQVSLYIQSQSPFKQCHFNDKKNLAFSKSDMPQSNLTVRADK